MRSHQYQCNVRSLCNTLLPTFLVLAALVALVRIGQTLRLMPSPAAALDPNVALLEHQSRAARSRNPAQIVLIGDSTCLVGADAVQLEHLLPAAPPALNLALLSWFSLGDYGRLAGEFAAANPGQVRTIVVLVTPEKLGMTVNQGQEQFWDQVRCNAGEPIGSGATVVMPADPFGLKCVRENLLSHVLATPLHNQTPGTAYFGFSSEIDRYMTCHLGSLFDFGSLARPRMLTKPTWRLAADLEQQTSTLRAAIPPGTQLFAGLTPLARSYSKPDDSHRRTELLVAWNRFLKADVLLTNLPASMPDVLFASKAHLNAAGQKRFTAILAREVAEHIGQADSARASN